MLVWSLVALSFFISPQVQAQPSQEALLQSFQWRNIGPANMGGRIVDIEAAETDFAHVFLASASGGVWKSQNAGTTWEPIFDRYGSASIGDIALFQPDPDIIWVGTGEANNRNSVSWGDGVYLSTDGGIQFHNVGLQSTQHIARIVTHPSEPGYALVCATGPLWGYTGERGIFLTNNAGASWRKIAGGLPDDGRTGCTDLTADPTNPDILYAAFYERLRKPWHFQSGGSNGGIFKSTDGGTSWTKLTAGLPDGDTGRIGLAVYRQDPSILMAIVEAEATNDLSEPGSGIYRSEDAGATWQYVNTYNNRPFYYSQIRINPLDDQRVYVLTTRFMVSNDGGKSLRNGSEDQEIHGDFHAMWIDPDDGDRYYIGADKGASLTHDHGRHFQLFDNLPLGQFYRIGVDMRDPYFVYGGLQDNGTYGVPSFSRDARGILNDSNWKLHWGDGQDIQIDPTDWRIVYTEMENGASFRYDALTYERRSIQPSPANVLNYRDVVPQEQSDDKPFRFNWSAPLVMSPHDPETLFAGGNYVFKTDDGGRSWSIVSPDLASYDPVKCATGHSGGITPDNTGAEDHCSVTTIAPSPLTADVIWAGTDDGNVHVTRDGGKSWMSVRETIPEVPREIWVSRIEASHFDPAVAYVAFDGHRSNVFTPWIFKTSDYGRTWTKLTSGFPSGHVVRVIREDRRNPQLLFAGTEFGVMATLNGGASWFPLTNGMPTVPVLDLVIHPRDDDLIAGTHGRSLWVLDDISPLQQLTEPVWNGDAFLFEPQTATIWKNNSRGGQRGHFWFAGQNPPEIEPSTSAPRAGFESIVHIPYYIRNNAQQARIEIYDEAENRHSASLETSAGIHRFRWNRTFDLVPFSEEQKGIVHQTFENVLKKHPYDSVRSAYRNFREAETAAQQRQALQIFDSSLLGIDLGPEYHVQKAGPGIYTVRIDVDGKTFETELIIREDPLTRH